MLNVPPRQIGRNSRPSVNDAIIIVLLFVLLCDACVGIIAGFCSNDVCDGHEEKRTAAAPAPAPYNLCVRGAYIYVRMSCFTRFAVHLFHLYM